ncbi:alpha/beta hydrolase [Curtobacterium flaccumfaciens pv. beticola]|uniref:Alpha/beta hydrolase fold domain-containing protein n=1 Tax=Curtobacterium citreum TaxID=2036 RepID=A0A850E1G5_9MICO|nr:MULTISPECIES: alpha/beta hydrolase fold domain-containing protein [Curtobacterium]MCS5485619.1 alpha/beta hydrolase [Curtobacterium flaccumfaciens pv. basellae]MDK8171063.1 alpha/beta hydrolase fold domain-containing protein [Curtobacterium citreum]NUU29483.1 alpha/beta hydrolase fold domain-containing protein [Curtobacterium albidum]
MRSRRRTMLALLAAGVAIGVLGALGSCSADPATDSNATVTTDPVIYPLSLRYPGIDVVTDVPYGADALQRLDVCLPPDSAPDTKTTPTAAPTPSPRPSAATDDAADRRGGRPAVMMVHGGSWSHGDKATAAYRAVCEYLASEGFVTVNVDYRLAPTDPFPAGLDDVRRALDWVFRPSTLAAYDIDAARVGVFGGSAGGNLVALLAVTDHESAAYAAGDRIRAVVDLSGPTDLTERSTRADGVSASFQRKQLLYLGCRTYTACPAAERASPTFHVTRDTAPFFVGHSTDEFIPLWESQEFVAALRAHDVPVTFVAVEGSAHSIAQLDRAMSERVVAFLHARLG